MYPIELHRFFSVWKTQILLFVAFVVLFQIMVLQLNPFFISIVALPLYYILVKGMTGRYLTKPISEGRMLFEVFVVSLVMRLLEVFGFYVVLQFFNDMPFLSEHDDFNYHNSMLQICGYWDEYGIQPIQASKIQFSRGVYSGYPYFGAFCMLLFGHNIFAARIGNAILSAVSVLIAYGILSNCVDRAKATFGTILFAFAPILMVFAACNFKDTALLTCILASIWGMTNYLNHRRWFVSSVVIVVSILFMLFCRPASIFILLSGCFLYLLIQGRHQKRPILIVALNCLAIVVTLFLWRQFYLAGMTDEYERFVELNMDASQRTIAETGKAGVSQFSFAKLLGAPLFIVASPFLPPTTIAYFPGKDQLTINYTFHGMLAYLTLLPMILTGVIEAIRRRRFVPIPLLLVVICFIYKIAQANSLLTIFSPRQSLPAIALFMLMIPIGLEKVRPASKFNFFVNLASISVVLAFNIFRYYF